MKCLEFYFDIVCPFAYIASTRVEEVAAKASAELIYRPILLGGVLKANTTDPWFTTKLPAAKTRHNIKDAERWAAYYGVPFRWNPDHPRRTLTTMRVLTAIGPDPRLIKALYQAYWVENKDLSDMGELAHVLAGLGHDADAVLAESNTDRVKQLLRRNTDHAVSKGVFGVPSMFVGHELFFGADRLDFAALELQGRA